MKEKTEVQGKFNEKSLYTQISYYLLISSAHYLKTLGFWNCFSIMKSEYLGQRDWRLEGFRNRMSHCSPFFKLINFLVTLFIIFFWRSLKDVFSFPIQFLLPPFPPSFSSSPPPLYPFHPSPFPGPQEIKQYIWNQKVKIWKKQILVCNWEWVVF